MTTLQINPAATPQQHIGSVKDYNVDTQELNGATKITYHPTQLSDADSDLADRLEQKAKQESLSLKVDSEQDFLDIQSDFEDLFPSEKRKRIEEYWTPIILQLDKEHTEACDRVTEFEEQETTFRAKLQAEYAYHLKHPDIIKKFC